jgi:hypothetical protein
MLITRSNFTFITQSAVTIMKFTFPSRGIRGTLGPGEKLFKGYFRLHDVEPCCDRVKYNYHMAKSQVVALGAILWRKLVQKSTMLVFLQTF